MHSIYNRKLKDNWKQSHFWSECFYFTQVFGLTIAEEINWSFNFTERDYCET